MKSSVDQKPPKGFGELRRNVKREQMTEDRYAQIEHENRLLLSKMSDIMQKGSVDNVSQAWQYGHSLNRRNRKKELERITEANQHILRRIQGVTPYYNHWQWVRSAARGGRRRRAAPSARRRARGAERAASATGLLSHSSLTIERPLRRPTLCPPRAGGGGGRRGEARLAALGLQAAPVDEPRAQQQPRARRERG